jgi:hypothetical protein
MTTNISTVLAPLIAIAKQDTAKLILPQLITFLTSISTNPNEVNILASVAKLEVDVLAALPTIAQDELKALAQIIQTEATALLAAK